MDGLLAFLISKVLYNKDFAEEGFLSDITIQNEITPTMRRIYFLSAEERNECNLLKMSDDGDGIQQPRNKTVVFTLEERKLLLKLVNVHYDVLNNKKVDSLSTQLKNNAWEDIHKKYLENTGLIKLPRTPQQLKRCWENMKCKAKKGDFMSVKLLRWGEAQYKLQQTRNCDAKEKVNGSFVTDYFDEDSDLELKDDVCNFDRSNKMEETQNPPNLSVNDNLIKNNESVDSDQCEHCSCEKNERNAKVQLLALQKQQSEELHNLKMQLTREKIQHEKELYKLYVHEMTLKVENERRRAEILERELGH